MGDRRNKLGSRKKPEEKLSEYIQIRVSPETKRKLEEIDAQNYGGTVSAYLRQSIEILINKASDDQDSGNTAGAALPGGGNEKPN